MKVYAFVYDYQGYEENVVGIFSSLEEIKERSKYTFNIKQQRTIFNIIIF